MKRIWEKLRRLIQRDKTGRDTPYVEKILYDETHHRLASLSLARYVDLLAEVGLPTTQQRENFVEYVSHAHSWYKHLPLNLPGAPFYFFVDRYAGMDRVIMKDGTQAFTERTKQGFHYSDIPTEEYRARFGHLAYSCDSGTTVFLSGPGPVVFPRDSVPAVPSQDAKMYGLPEEILEAGLTRLTHVIHTCSATHLFWKHVKHWPEESGGQAVLEKIVARSQSIREPTFQGPVYTFEDQEALAQANPYIWVHFLSTDPVLNELLAPERRRQYGKMLKAIDRVCKVIERERIRATSQGHLF